MADFKFTKRPDPEIKYGMLQQSSEKEIQEWLVYNMQKFLATELHIPNPDIVKYKKEITDFCRDVYIELHDVGYTEGVEATEYDFAENEGL